MQRAPLILTLLLASLAALSMGTHAIAQPDDPPVEKGEEGEPAADGTDGAETPEGTPEGTDPAATTDAPETADEDLQSLRAEYFKLRDRLFQSRARSSAVSSALYSTRMSIDLNYGSGRYYTITRSTIRLDGASIYDDTEGTIASDKATRFEGFIAPGRHQVSIRIEATGKDDERFTSVLDNSFVVQAVKDKDLVIKAKAADGGNIAYKWAKKETGTYRLHLNVSVKSAKRAKKKSDRIKRTGELRKHGPAKTNRS
jgi:hypothetical protein